MEKSPDQAEASGWTPEPDVGSGSGGQRLDTIRQRRDALGAAMQALETTVARSAAAPGWAGGVGAAIAEVRRALEAHIADVEGPDGLLEEILDLAPRLAHMTQEIEDEHDTLLESVIRVEKAVDRDADPRATRRAVISLLGGLVIHRQRGSDLIYEAYNVDIGTGY